MTRYLSLRADTLMGMFRRLPPALRAQALAALAGSTFEHGGDSARRYLESAGGDAAALLGKIERAALDLGWGTWRFERGKTQLTLTVADSPFAAAYADAPQAVCAPITGMLRAVAELVLGGPCDAREVECRASRAPDCRFEALLRSRP